MYTDPNWLLSTIVQSAAAFVAIVAGFIISRLLALSAERGGLQTRVRDIRLQLAIKKENIQTLEKRLLEWDAEDFLEDPDVLDMIIESEGQTSLADTMGRVTGHYRSEDELRPYWDEAIAVTKGAFLLIRERYSELLVEIRDLDAALKSLGLELSSYRSKIYHRVFASIFDEHNKKQNPLWSSLGLSGIVPISELRATDEINRYRLLERDIEALERDKIALETQLSDLKIQLTQLGQPKGIALGIVFLAYFSLTGIVIPVFLLPFPPEQFTTTHKWSVFLLFLSGLLFFFLYLLKLIRQVAETSDSDSSN